MSLLEEGAIMFTNNIKILCESCSWGQTMIKLMRVSTGDLMWGRVDLFPAFGHYGIGRWQWFQESYRILLLEQEETPEHPSHKGKYTNLVLVMEYVDSPPPITPGFRGPGFIMDRAGRKTPIRWECLSQT
jgi:hypothetical protein